MSRLFDPVALMSENLAANATKTDPLPIGETTGQIMEIGFSDGLSGPQSKNPGTPWNRLDAKIEITDPEYLGQYPGKPEKVVRSLGIMLDMQNGQIASGPNKNVRLGKLREATGTNGKPLNMMVGCYIRITIGHRVNPKDPDGGVLDEITAYTKV